MTRAQKLLVWLMIRAETPSIIMLTKSRWFMLKRSARNPDGMFINSAAMLGTVATNEVSIRLS